MFHRAEPDEAGFGVMTSTPGLTRSSHVLMLSGLPGRTTNTTTDEVMMPFVLSWFQSSATLPSSTRRVTSVSSEKCTKSAACPPATARLWSPEAPYDVLKVTPLPSSVFSKALNTSSLALLRMEKPTTSTVSFFTSANEDVFKAFEKTDD